MRRIEVDINNVESLFSIRLFEEGDLVKGLRTRGVDLVIEIAHEPTYAVTCVAEGNSGDGKSRALKKRRYTLRGESIEEENLGESPPGSEMYQTFVSILREEKR